MKAPVAGIAGTVWRTLTAPTRAGAPFVLLARRALTGNYWTESITERVGVRPAVRLSDREDIQHAADGAGPLNHRMYRVQIADPSLDDSALLAAFSGDPNRFCPTSYATVVPEADHAALVSGTTHEVKLPGPWNGPVHVGLVEPGRLRLETLDGHMEAGWIQFVASLEDGLLEFTIESLARSGDPVFDTLYHRIGVAKLIQTEMWVQVLESAVEFSGGSQRGRIEVETIIYHGADR